ncbi:MAG: hypothetical protein NW208_00895 [Bryobacter sp.]|nr:hypothetical protein [Bryobacter sp.]
MTSTYSAKELGEMATGYSTDGLRRNLVELAIENAYLRGKLETIREYEQTSAALDNARAYGRISDQVEASAAQFSTVVSVLGAQTRIDYVEETDPEVAVRIVAGGHREEQRLFVAVIPGEHQALPFAGGNVAWTSGLLPDTPEATTEEPQPSEAGVA